MCGICVCVCFIYTTSSPKNKGLVESMTPCEFSKHKNKTCF